MDNKIIIYIDLDDTIFDYQGAVKRDLEIDPRQPYPQSKVHFFFNLEPFDDAISVIKWLFEQDIFEVYFLTAPSVENPLCYTEKRLSLDKHFGKKIGSRIIISPNKGLNLGHYLIDDITEGKGQENFKGEILKFGDQNFPSWKSVKIYFQNKYDLN